MFLLLPTSFSRPGSAKISENPQKSSDLPHHGLHAETHVTKRTQQAKESVQKHGCSGLHRTQGEPAAVLHTLGSSARSLRFVAHIRVVTFSGSCQADPELFQTAASAS